MRVEPILLEPGHECLVLKLSLLNAQANLSSKVSGLTLGLMHYLHRYLVYTGSAVAQW